VFKSKQRFDSPKSLTVVDEILFTPRYRAFLVLGMKDSFYDLVSQWKWGMPVVEDGKQRSVELVILFDHDYLLHVLFKEWNTAISESPVGFTLWFFGHEQPVQVAHWDNDTAFPVPPISECGALVEDWMRTLYEMEE
jgi:hypothetical protein